MLWTSLLLPHVALKNVMLPKRMSCPINITKLQENVELTDDNQATANDLKPREMATKTLKGHIIIGVEMKKILICMNCKTKLTAIADDAVIM